MGRHKDDRSSNASRAADADAAEARKLAEIEAILAECGTPRQFWPRAARADDAKLLRNAATGVAEALTRDLLASNASAAAATASGRKLSPDVAACREMSPDVRSADAIPTGGRSYAGGFPPAAVSADVAACREVSPGVRSADVPTNLGETSHLFPRPAVSPGVAACRQMSPDVRFFKVGKNEEKIGAAIPLALRAGAGGGLNEAQLAAIRMLLDGRRVTDIARELLITTRTLLRWRKSAAFVAEFCRLHERRCVTR